MKRLIFVLVLILVFLLCFTSCGGGYTKTKEYPIASIRYYIEVTEDGLFTTKTNTDEKIEFIFIDSSGQYIKHTISAYRVKISNESKVVEEEGYFSPHLYLTLEDYENLLQSEQRKE